MLKNFFLALSTTPGLRRWAERSPAARRLSSRFIAGNELADGIAVLRALKEKGLLTALDPLGENVTTEREAREAAQNADTTLRAVAAEKAGATMSIKLTHFGLDLSTELALENILPLMRLAKALDTRVEVDMESSAYTERTVRILEKMHAEGPVRAVLQAYLYRTEEDLRRLSAAGVPVRLCKGAYNEPATVAMPKKRDVDRNFLKLADILLESGTYPAFATHDPAMIRHVTAAAPAPESFEFQMLYGIRRELQSQVRAEGWRLRLYVPYGSAWYPYFMRRLAERPANVWFVLRGAFS